MSRTALVLGLLCTLAAPLVWADDTHYQDYIVGDQAVGMGGAYTAIAADPSGIWYNPAGIVDVRDTSLSLSANLYGINDATVGSEGNVLPKDPISKLVVVPASAGFVQAIGRTDENGQRPYAFGMSIVVPSYRKFSTAEEGTATDPVLGEYRHGYHRAFMDETLWVGAGGAMRMANLSLGAGLVLIHRSLQDSASSFVATDLQDGEYHTFRNALMDMNFSNDSVLLTAGLKLKLSEGLFFGAMVRSPSLAVYSAGSMRFARARADTTGSGFIPTPPEVKLTSESRTNGEGRAGLAYQIPGLLLIAADVSFFLPVAYTLVDVDEQDAAARAALQKTLLIAPEVKRQLTVNGNLGAELQFLEKFSVALGAFTNFASSPPVPGGADARPSLAHVNMVGGTLAFGIFSEHTLTRLGILYARGKGQDVIAVNDPSQLALDNQNFVKVDLVQSYFYFFLSSTFRY